MSFDVLTSGYVSMDRILKIDRPAAVGFTSLVTNRDNAVINYGGCSVNIACALSKLGLAAAPVIRVGGDYQSTGFQDFLRSGGVPTDGVTVLEEESTSCCYLVQDPEGNHITLFYPGAMDARYSRPLPDALFQGARMGVVTVAAQPDNREFVRQCRQHNVPLAFGMKSDFDAFPKDFLWELLTCSKIVFTNEVERSTIEELFQLQAITDLFRMGQAEIIITTYGKEGSTYYLRDGDGFQSQCIPICQCTKVVDTTGSGDAYIAGFLYGHLSGAPVADCCMLGSTLSSFVIEAEGCCTNLPDRARLEKRFDDFKACPIP